MNFFHLLHTCLRSILRNSRMRNFLTSLGAIIGAGSVIVMVALGEGSRRAIEARITAMGTNLLRITHRPPPPHLRTAGTGIAAFIRLKIDPIGFLG